MKILTVSNYFPNHAGGIEIVAKNLVENWRRQTSVHWAACVVDTWQDYQEGDIPLTAYNFTETRLGFPYPIPNLSSIKKIAEQVRWADIVHLHDCLYLSNLIAFLSAKFFSKPLITTQHIGIVPYQENYKVVLQWLAYQTFGRLVLNGSDKAIFINDKIRRWFTENIGLNQSQVLQNGVDHKIFYPAQSKTERSSIRKRIGYSEDDFIFLFVGRFTSKKGIDLILNIAHFFPDKKWLMIGSGDIPAMLNKGNNIKTLPYQSQIALRDFYIAANLFVLPSYGEGFPLSVQEALTCGLPAAVSQETASSLPDAPLIGLDIDSIPNIINSLDNTVSHPDILDELSRSSIEFAKQWDWDLVSSQYLKIFNKALQKIHK